MHVFVLFSLSSTVPLFKNKKQTLKACISLSRNSDLFTLFIFVIVVSRNAWFLKNLWCSLLLIFVHFIWADWVKAQDSFLLLMSWQWGPMLYVMSSCWKRDLSLRVLLWCHMTHLGSNLHQSGVKIFSEYDENIPAIAKSWSDWFRSPRFSDVTVKSCLFLFTLSGAWTLAFRLLRDRGFGLHTVAVVLSYVYISLLTWSLMRSTSSAF